MMDAQNVVKSKEEINIMEMRKDVEEILDDHYICQNRLSVLKKYMRYRAPE